MTMQKKNVMHAAFNLGIVSGVLLFIPIFFGIAGQSADSLSQKKMDSTASLQADSRGFSSFSKRHGTMLLLDSAGTIEISKHSIQLLNYTGLSHILSEKTPFFSLSLGTEGQFNHFSALGSTPRDIAFSINGRTLNDVALGAYNPEQFPVEFMEKAEIILGSNAVILADNSVGALVNIQEIQYNSAKPFTRIYFAQGGYKFLASDGVFAQNLARNINLNLGFHRASADGEFLNSSMDSWTLRGGLRWAMSERSTLSFSEIFTNHFLGTNGGINADSSSDMFNPLTAIPNFSLLNERVYRHDISLAYSSFPSADSSTAISSVAYFSHADCLRGRADNLFLSAADSLSVIEWGTEKIGINGRFEQNFSAFRMTFGGNLQHDEADATVYSSGGSRNSLAGFASISLHIGRDFSLSGGARALLADEKLRLALGARSELTLSSTAVMSMDISRAMRSPTLAEGLGLSPEEHLLFLLGFEWREAGFSLSARGFFRKISNPILAEAIRNADNLPISTSFLNADSRMISGVHIQGKYALKSLIFGANALVQYSQTNDNADKRFPLFSGAMSAEYQYSPRKSILRGGLQIHALTGFRGEQFIPQTWAYISADRESSAGISLDLIASVSVGNAFVRFTYQNILSRNYYAVPYYPANDANLRLSFSWSFFD